MAAPPARNAPRGIIMLPMQTPQPLTFRTATDADIPAIVALVESAYRGDSGRRGWTTESELLDGRRTDAEAVAALARLQESPADIAAAAI